MELRYIELKTGWNDNGPAWIGFVKESRSGKMVYRAWPDRYLEYKPVIIEHVLETGKTRYCLTGSAAP